MTAVSTLVDLCINIFLKDLKSPQIIYDWDNCKWIIRDKQLSLLPEDLIERFNLIHCDKCGQQKLTRLCEYWVEYKFDQYRVILCDFCWVSSVKIVDRVGPGGLFRLDICGFKYPSAKLVNLLNTINDRIQIYGELHPKKLPTIIFPHISHINEPEDHIIRHTLVAKDLGDNAILYLGKLFELLETISAQPHSKLFSQ